MLFGGGGGGRGVEVENWLLPTIPLYAATATECDKKGGNTDY